MPQPATYLGLDSVMVLRGHRKHGPNIDLVRLLLLDCRLHFRGIPERLVTDVDVIVDGKGKLPAREEVPDYMPTLTIRVIAIRQPFEHGLIREQACVEEAKQLRAEFLVVHRGCGRASDVHAVLVLGAGRGGPAGGGSCVHSRLRYEGISMGRRIMTTIGRGVILEEEIEMCMCMGDGGGGLG